MFGVADSVFVAEALVFFRHTEFLACHEAEGWVEISHGHQQRVDRAAVFEVADEGDGEIFEGCLLYTSPSPRDPKTSRMPSSA